MPAHNKNLDPGLASLFSSSFGAVTAPIRAAARKPVDTAGSNVNSPADAPGDDHAAGSGTDEELDAPAPAPAAEEQKKRKRKRKDEDDALEGVYMKKLQDSEVASEKKRSSKKSKKEKKAHGEDEEHGSDNNAASDSDSDSEEDSKDDKEGSPIVHESLVSKSDKELDKSMRTVFLGNVPSTAISSKADYKTLKTYFSTVGPIHSVRFRSIAFSEQIPRKAAFVKHKFHDKQQTVNVYIVYKTQSAARAALSLNGKLCLDRHIRVDSVAHPAKHEPKRCVFVGNLDFEAQEETLWRHFASCGNVESVRIVRDSKTNVGKGFAYVQFEDINSIEQALLLDGKKMANDRKLRISQAKAIKRNAPQPNIRRPAPQKSKPTKQRSVYVPKPDPKAQQIVGRAHKLLGKAGAAALRKQSEVFEGLRATSQTDSGIRSGGTGKKKGKPRARVTNRSTSWKSKTPSSA